MRLLRQLLVMQYPNPSFGLLQLFRSLTTDSWAYGARWAVEKPEGRRARACGLQSEDGRSLPKQFARQLHCQPRALARRQSNLVRGYITGFDTHHSFIFLVSKIGHLLSFGNPWVPHNSRKRCFLLYPNFTAQTSIRNFDGPGSVQVDAIGFGANLKGITHFNLLRKICDLVQIGHALQSGNGNGADIANCEVSVQTIFENKFFRRGIVGHHKLECQRLTHRHDVIHIERLKSRCFGAIRQTKTQTDAAIGGWCKLLQLPGLSARKAVLPHAFTWTKPREHNRDAAADRLTGFEPAALA